MNLASSPDGAAGRRFSSPLRAMLWKEWRESWWLLIPGMLAPGAQLLAHEALRDRNSTMMSIAQAVLGVMIGVTVYGLGALPFASEMAGRTAGFRDMQPVPRATVWRARVTLPACALLLGILALLILALQSTALPHKATLEYAGEMSLYTVVAFCAASFCGVLLDRPLTAMAAGVAVSVAMLMCHVWLAFLVYGNAGPGKLFIGLTVAAMVIEAIALLLAGRIIFIRWRRT